MEEKWFNLSQKATEEKLQTNIKSGLSSDEVKKRYETYGKNVLKERAKKSLLQKFIDQFKDFMINSCCCKCYNWCCSRK